METALQKVQMAEDAWNTRDPEKICRPQSARSLRPHERDRLPPGFPQAGLDFGRRGFCELFLHVV